MNNPLVPQGSLLEQKNKSRARVKIAVFVVLGIHGIGLLALLMQGCKKEPDLGGQTEATNNAAPAFVEPTNAPLAMTNDLMAATNVTSAAVDTHALTTTGATEYIIAKGDTFSIIAKKFHVTTKALMDANPGVEPTKLKIGEKINIPAAAASTTTTSTSGATTTAAGTGEQNYTVKSGDSLTKIATQFGTTVKAIRSLNSLKTDKIVVGQKLRIPAKGSGATATDTNQTPATSTGTPTGQ
ncbi:MAG TPA: LysM peptidoglycan-binding domain-containing protein [Candidatus Limnocylindrales bacterium]|jgi:LysM repeat protein|nr:LysM peptidoglycan-binding domain-containing protein [Candidatus Limnocylindrales bacterium]